MSGEEKNEYKNLYLTLFRGITKAIDDLQKLQQLAEEKFIESDALDDKD